jgi:N-methylhydantoinase A
VSLHIGVDIGGTFTDALVYDESTGAARIAKVPSTPTDPSIGFLRALRELVEPGDATRIVHGTTVATNAIIEGNLARTAFVTTRGFRDLLEIARQTRPSLYDLQFEKPRPLVPRDLCFEVPERLDARGEVLEPLDEAAVQALAEQLRGVASVAVCFLHSYLNPVHEQRVGKMLRAALPGVSVSLSAEVAPEFREYFRASTTIINAGIRPVVEGYLHGITSSLTADGFTNASLLVMQSNGGVMTAESAVERPVFMVESGPAAGVMAAAYLAAQLGLSDVMSFDMGGTTAKAGLVRNGRPAVTKDYEVGTRAGAARGSGYPIRTPVIDLVEIGAGGGSVAWVDPGGVLRVGPRSAGADPGPACYGQGGREPTVTDANLVLGRLNPANFLGGAMVLDPDAAARALEKFCAQPLGCSIIAAAHGIVEIANAAMTQALHLVSVQRGYDPREFALVAFGGAGPLHANALAAELHIPTTIIPTSPGITSAMGLLATDLTHDYVRTVRQTTATLDRKALSSAFQRLQTDGRATLAREGVPATAMSFRHALEMRYIGQSFELLIDVPGGDLTGDDLQHAENAFHQAHERAYGFAAPAEPTEVMNIRLTAIGVIDKPRLRGRGAPASGDARTASRVVYFSDTERLGECPIYDRYRLPIGTVIDGPAVIEELDSTTLIQPGYRATVDVLDNLVLVPNR